MVDLNVIEKLTAVIKQNKELSAHYTGAHKAIHHAAITLAHLLNDGTKNFGSLIFLFWKVDTNLDFC
jgi:hypothetical protein